ncbi:MAG TPA: ribulose-phosphate 3-epimerase [Thermoanaerobaculia bacterium]|nr:ribulose-phosphate 3-epimerase [Thermoanaerobaculia bacterium]
MSVSLAPSLLSADFSRLGEAARACEDGGADWIHFDVMDGRFVPNLTVGPIVLNALRKVTRVPFDVHLMIEAPLSTLDQYLDAGASRVAVHVEAEPHLHRFAQHALGRGVSPGVAINPGTALASVDEALLFVDFVLVMTVNPGWGGQAFIEGSLDRVARLSEMIRRSGSRATIAVDGGVGPGNIGDLVRSGARHFVAGASVFSAGDVPGSIKRLREAAGSTGTLRA